MWESATLRDMFSRGLVMDFFEDVEGQEESLQAVTIQIIEKVDEALGNFDAVPAAPMREAMLLVGLLLTQEYTWNPNNDILVSHLIGTLMHGSFRAHKDGVRQYSQGSWDRIEEIHEIWQRRFDRAICKAIVIFQRLTEAGIERL